MYQQEFAKITYFSGSYSCVKLKEGEHINSKCMLEILQCIFEPGKQLNLAVTAEIQALDTL